MRDQQNRSSQQTSYAHSGQTTGKRCQAFGVYRRCLRRMRVSGRIQNIDDDLQPVQPMSAAHPLVEIALCNCRRWGRGSRHGDSQRQ